MPLVSVIEAPYHAEVPPPEEQADEDDERRERQGAPEEARLEDIAEEIEDDDEPFYEKMKRLTVKLEEQFVERRCPESSERIGDEKVRRGVVGGS